MADIYLDSPGPQNGGQQGMGGGGMGGGGFDFMSALRMARAGSMLGQAQTNIAALRTQWASLKDRFGRDVPDASDATKNGLRALTKTANTNFNNTVSLDATSAATLTEGLVRVFDRLGEALGGIDTQLNVMQEVVYLLCANADADSKLELFTSMGQNGLLAAALTGAFNTPAPAQVLPPK